MSNKTKGGKTMAAKLCQTCDFSKGYGGTCIERCIPGDGLYHEPECKYYVPADFVFVERALRKDGCMYKPCEADNRVYEE